MVAWGKIPVYMSGIHWLAADSDIFGFGALTSGICNLRFLVFVRDFHSLRSAAGHHVGGTAFCQSFAHAGRTLMSLVGNEFKHVNSIFFLNFRTDMCKKTMIRWVVCHLEVCDQVTFRINCGLDDVTHAKNLVLFHQTDFRIGQGQLGFSVLSMCSR